MCLVHESKNFGCILIGELDVNIILWLDLVFGDFLDFSQNRHSCCFKFYLYKINKSHNSQNLMIEFEWVLDRAIMQVGWFKYKKLEDGSSIFG